MEPCAQVYNVLCSSCGSHIGFFASSEETGDVVVKTKCLTCREREKETDETKGGSKGFSRTSSELPLASNKKLENTDSAEKNALLLKGKQHGKTKN